MVLSSWEAKDPHAPAFEDPASLPSPLRSLPVMPGLELFPPFSGDFCRALMPLPWPFSALGTRGQLPAKWDLLPHDQHRFSWSIVCAKLHSLPFLQPSSVRKYWHGGPFPPPPALGFPFPWPFSPSGSSCLFGFISLIFGLTLAVFLSCLSVRATCSISAKSKVAKRSTELAAGALSCISVDLASEIRNRTSAWVSRIFRTRRLKPLTRTEASGSATPMSLALRRHLVHLLSCRTASCSVFASGVFSRFLRIASFSPIPPG